MENRKAVPLLLILVLSSLTTTIASKSYIVYFGGHPPRTEVSLDDYERAKDFHHEFLASFLGNKEKAQDAVFYSYKHINAFAAHLSDKEASEISSHPRVLSVIENIPYRLHTTRTWGFMGLERDGRIQDTSIWKKARLGEDAIIGSLDTGIWPESQSFNDEGMGPVPSRWKGFCQNNTKEGVPCNKKIIGARYFNKGAVMAALVTNETLYSARDFEGHGSHTISTAAGRLVPGANIFGVANGTAAGGSPNARIAMYKVCFSRGCYSVDILAGFDAAIDDSVDIISASIGGPYNSYLIDPIAIGSFHAVMKGITVVCSAGNTGPEVATVSNSAPWITTVAASTLDREFPSYARLGNNKRLKGQSLSSVTLPKGNLYPLIDSTSAKLPNKTDRDALCLNETLDPEKVKGKIVVCARGNIPRMDKGLFVHQAGGVGMIVVNTESDTDGLYADPHILPATHISYSDGVALYSYMNSTKSPMGYIEAPTTTYDVKPSPFVAGFSSRGPNLITPQILKPDITAPGVQVLAAFTQDQPATIFDYDKRHVKYNLLSGTSMSCPHVSGIAGLLKTLYPDWSPSMVRSAIMTTAGTRDNTMGPILELNYVGNYSKANAFDYGSGHVRPNHAMYPGLVYDVGVTDYLNFLCALGYNSSHMALFSEKPYSCPSKPMKIEDLNYPSISIANLNSTTTVTRAVTNVGPPGAYDVRVEAPAGISVSVEPKTLKFEKDGEVRKFKVTMEVEHPGTVKGYKFGRLIWSDGKHYVRSPIVVYVPPVKS